MDFDEIVKWSEQKRKDQQDERGTFEKILSFSVVAFVIIICAIPLFFSEIQKMRYEVKSLKKSGKESEVKKINEPKEEIKVLPQVLPPKQKVLRIKKKQPKQQHKQENEKQETKEVKQEEEIIYVDDETGNPIDPTQLDDYEIVEEDNE